jgi:hypothetical protein
MIVTDAAAEIIGLNEGDAKEAGFKKISGGYIENIKSDLRESQNPTSPNYKQSTID